LKRVVVTVINDLETDNRVRKTCDVLLEAGYSVTLVGRILPESKSLNRSYETRRFWLPFRKGFLFYAFYNVRLFLFLMFRPFDLYLANDLDTALPNLFWSKLRSKPMIFDSHEFFTEVPEIQDRAIVKKVWTSIERFVFRNAPYIINVSDSIADAYFERYGKKSVVVRNIPAKPGVIQPYDKAKLSISETTRVLILQGSGINVDRGGEEAVMAMEYLSNTVLLVVGSGDALPVMKDIAMRKGLLDKVKFIPRVPFEDLLAYTAMADLGLAIDKVTNLNYKYALPNKLFDYLHVQTPIVCADGIEIRRIVERFQIGFAIPSHDPKKMADSIAAALENRPQMEQWKSNCTKAADELTWEREKEKLRKLIDESERY
jgi:glycosyltransferase involved in cell wall biosynthesis